MEIILIVFGTTVVSGFLGYFIADIIFAKTIGKDKG